MTDMTIAELKTAVERYRQDLKSKAGKIVNFSESGPVGMTVIDSIVEMLEAQQKRIEELERK